MSQNTWGTDALVRDPRGQEQEQERGGGPPIPSPFPAEPVGVSASTLPQAPCSALLPQCGGEEAPISLEGEAPGTSDGLPPWFLFSSLKE